MIWGPRDNAQFNSLYNPVRVKEAGAGLARVRIMPQPILTSATGRMHGGATAGLIDIALFAGIRGCGIQHEGIAVTLDLSIQYIAPGLDGQPLDAVVESIRETGRMAFGRGKGEQEAGTIATDRKSVEKGKRVEGRVDSGGRSSIK